MDIAALDRARALCAAKLIEMDQLGVPSDDAEERLAIAIARTQAERAYRVAESEYQRAIALLSEDELAEVLKVRQERAA